MTITKAISIICQYTEAGMLATLSSNGITVNAPVMPAAILSGMDHLHGACSGLNGVRYIAGASLTIENSRIRMFGAASGQGVLVAPTTGTLRLTIIDTTIASNGNAATGGGVLIAPTGTGVANATLRNVNVVSNANGGVIVNGASTVMIMNSLIGYNANFGIRTASGSPTVRVGATTITGNGTGVSVGACTIESYGTNQLNGNTGDGAFFGAFIPPK